LTISPVMATYASRNGISLEIAPRVVLRHNDLKTTQVYLGKVSEQDEIFFAITCPLG
jgi:hypothetical protein